MEKIRKASELGCGTARAFLGESLLLGKNVPKDEAAGLELVKEAATQNEPDALFSLGSMYASGKAGVGQDMAAAEEYLRRAVDLGCDRARYSLALTLLGLHRGVDALVELKQAASNVGDIASQRELAGWEENALAGPMDLPDAFKMYCRVAKETSLPSDAIKVAAMYRGGVGTPRNSELSKELLEWADRHGSAEARYLLARAYLAGEYGPIDVAQGTTLLKKAAEDGHVPAQVELARVYLEGVWLDRNVEQARRWLEAAAGKGSPQGKLYLNALNEAEKK
jgi:hypothetical protein